MPYPALKRITSQELGKKLAHLNFCDYLYSVNTQEHFFFCGREEMVVRDEAMEVAAEDWTDGYFDSEIIEAITRDIERMKERAGLYV